MKSHRTRSHIGLTVLGVCLLGLVGLVLFLTLHPTATAAPPVPPYHYTPPLGYVCYRATEPVNVDGRLDEKTWESAAWSEDFGDIEGSLKPKPRFRTRVKMLWDDQALYIAAELEEPHVWATLKEHDSVIFHDNDFEVFLDPDGNSHLYGELELNALNTTWDLLLPKPYKDGGPAVDAWEITGLRTAVHVDGTLNDPSDRDRGWTVEIAWPWKSLAELTHRPFPVPPKDGAQWRINFSRVEREHEVVEGKYRKVEGKREDNWVWSPQGTIDMHRPERWGFLQFSTAQPGSAAFRPDPAEPTRKLLHQVYYAQHDYHEQHGRYAGSLAELGLRGVGVDRMEVTSHGFEASAVAPTSQRWHIAADARIWVE